VRAQLAQCQAEKAALDQQLEHAKAATLDEASRLAAEKRAADERGKELADARSNLERTRLQLSEAHADAQREAEAHRQLRSHADKLRERLDSVEADARAAAREALREVKNVGAQREAAEKEGARVREQLANLSSDQVAVTHTPAHPSPPSHARLVTHQPTRARHLTLARHALPHPSPPSHARRTSPQGRLQAAAEHAEQQMSALREEKAAVERKAKRLEDELRASETRSRAADAELLGRSTHAEHRAAEVCACAVCA
jgi:hypothetical protein